MNFRTFLIAAAYLCLNFMPQTILADTVFLKNGKEIKVEKAWQEGDQIWLIYHGMKAGIPHRKVKRIESDSQNTATSGSLENHIKAANSKPDLQPAEKIPLPAQPINTTPVLCTDGLGDLKWGVQAASIKGLEEKQVDSGLQDVIEYVRPSDTLKLGEATLESIVYAFWRDQLYTITIWAQGRENFNALRQSVFKKFGNGIRPNHSIERYLWSDGPADIMLKYANDDQYGMLWMRSKNVDRKFKLSKLNGHTSYLRRMKSRN